MIKYFQLFVQSLIHLINEVVPIKRCQVIGKTALTREMELTFSKLNLLSAISDLLQLPRGIIEKLQTRSSITLRLTMCRSENVFDTWSMIFYSDLLMICIGFRFSSLKIGHMEEKTNRAIVGVNSFLTPFVWDFIAFICIINWIKKICSLRGNVYWIATWNVIGFQMYREYTHIYATSFQLNKHYSD